VALIFGAKIGEVEGMINLCIPHIVVEPIVSKLNTKFWFPVLKRSNKRRQRNHSEKIEYTKVLSEQYWEEQPFKWLIFLNYNRGM